MHHFIDSIAHTMAFVIPVVECTLKGIDLKVDYVGIYIYI